MLETKERIGNSAYSTETDKSMNFIISPIHKGSASILIKTIESKKTSQGQFLVYNV